MLGPYPPSTALVFTQILIMAAQEGTMIENLTVPLVNIMLARSPGS